MPFIETRTGAVNADSVAKITRVKRAGEVITVLMDSTDKEIGETYTDALAVTESLLPVVPAAPGAFAWIITYDNMDDICYTQQYSIVAWRVTDKVPTPVLAGETVSGDHILIVRPDGKLDDLCDSYYENIEEAKRRIREQHKSAA